MIRIIKIILIIFLFLIAPFTLTPQQDPPQDLSTRVKILEGQKENIDQKTQNAIENLNQKIENKLEQVYWILGFLGLVGASSIFGIWRYLSKKVKEIGEEQLEKKFDKLFEEKKKVIEKMIQDHNVEMQLKKSKRILVLNPKKSNDTFLQKFFKKEGFDKVEYQKIGEKINFRNIDLILFNYEDEKCDEDFMLEIISKAKGNTIFFYFGSKIIFKEETVNKISFANVRVQLYGNLMNALRYQELLT